MRRCILALGAPVLLVFAATEAWGAAQRSFVSSNGDDGNACSLAAPCRSFASAISNTLAGGEVIVLDSAGYGPVTITQSVSIIAPPGVYAGISVFTGDGVTVSAGPADKVVLRGLTINGQGGTNGIHVTSGLETHVEDCTISNMSGHGIQVEGDSSVHISQIVVRSNAGHGLYVPSGNPSISVSDSRFAQNGSRGIRLDAGSLDGSRLTVDGNGSDGVLADNALAATVTVTLTDSMIAANGADGVIAITRSNVGSNVNIATTRVTSSGNVGVGFVVECLTGGGDATMVVSDSVATENFQGVSAIGVCGPLHATAIVSGSTLARNTDSDLVQNLAGILRSSANNTLTGRGAADITGTITPNPLK